MILRLKRKFFNDVLPLSYTSRHTTSWDDVHDYIRDTNPNLIIHDCKYYGTTYVVKISNDDANLTWFKLKYSNYILPND